MAANESSASDQGQSDAPAEPRRNFVFEIASIAIGGIVSLAPLLVGAYSFVDPLFRRRQKPLAYADEPGLPDDGFIRIGSLDALTVEAPPQRFPVIADKQDAWNYIPDQPIGAVFVERIAEQEVRVFNATCPHAGCSVACNGTAFHCPCHNSSFNLDGTKIEPTSGRTNPSPRDLDKLAVDPNRLSKDREVWVKFQNFYTGRHEQKPKS